MNPKSTFILVVLLITTSLSAAARPDSFDPLSSEKGLLDGDYGVGFGDPIGGIGAGIGDPIGGIGAGIGDPIGGIGPGIGDPTAGISPDTTVCSEQGPCYMKKLTCPAKCYTQHSKSGNGYHVTAGSGGCTMDCTVKCEAYC